MKAWLSTGLMSVALAGCVSAPNTPSLVLNSSKPPSEYAHCAYPKWRESNANTSLSQHRGNFTLVAQSSIRANQIMNVYKDGEGSQVEFYGPVVAPLARPALLNSARACL